MMIPSSILKEAAKRILTQSRSDEVGEFVPDTIVDFCEHVMDMEGRNLDRFFAQVEFLYNEMYDTY